VAALKERGAVRTPFLEAAFNKVPRHVFTPDVSVADAYRDRSYPIKIQDGVVVSSSSQPAIMAEMLEQLAPQPGERILEIGAGSGYNAALLAELVGINGFVSTVDLDQDIVKIARRNLCKAGYDQVRTVCVDGAEGDSLSAPFDAIIATVGVGDIPPAWVAQLRVGGRLIAPISLGLAQRIVTFERTNTCLKSRSVVGGEFMAFRGSSTAASIGELSTLGDPAVRLRTLPGNTVNADVLTGVLGGECMQIELPANITVDDVWESLDLWLSIREPLFCRLTAQGTAAQRGRVPDAMGIANAASHPVAATLGLCNRDGLVLFALTTTGMCQRAFGSSAACTERLMQAIQSWEDQGRPANAGLNIKVFSASSQAADALTDGAHLVTLPSAHFVLQWA